MKNLLPESVISKPKRGFNIPLSSWLRTDLKYFCDAVISKEKIDALGVFNYPYIEKIKAEHFKGVKNNSRKLWTLLVLCLWYERWMQ